MNLNSCWSTYSVVTIFSTTSSQRFWMEFFLSPWRKVNCSSGGRLRAALWLRQKLDDRPEVTWKDCMMTTVTRNRVTEGPRTARGSTETTTTMQQPVKQQKLQRTHRQRSSSLWTCSHFWTPPSHSSSPTPSHMHWPGVFLNRPRRESLSLLSKRALARILLWTWWDGEDILLGGRAQRFFSKPWDLKSIGSCVLLDTVSTLASCALWERRRHSPAALLKSCWFKT